MSGAPRPGALALAHALACACACAAAVTPGPAHAQELEPRAFSAAPVGTTFVLAGAGRSQGAIVLDATLDVENVHADLDVRTFGFGRVLALGGRQARVLAVLSHAHGTVTADVGSLPRHAPLSGLVDPRIKLSIGLAGAPALKAAELASAPRAAVIAASVTVVPPWGDYDADNLVNLGYNRWALKPEIGVSYPRGRWTIESAAGAWVYSRNDAHFPGASHKRQKPLGSVQAHVSYTWSSRVWLALDAASFSGGETRVDGVANPDYQENSRVGVTVSLPLGARQSLKLAYSEGATTRRGNDFDSFTATWQLVRVGR